MFNFWLTSTRNGHLATEIWHVCARGRWNDERRRVERCPKEGASFECPGCSTGMGA